MTVIMVCCNQNRLYECYYCATQLCQHSLGSRNSVYLSVTHLFSD